MGAPFSQACASAVCGCRPFVSLSRRTFLTGAAVAIGTAPRFIAKAVAQTPATRIDVHHHISAPTWVDSLKSLKKGNAPILNWSAQKSIDDMDKGGVATSITSPAPPHLSMASAA